MVMLKLYGVDKKWIISTEGGYIKKERPNNREIHQLKFAKLVKTFTLATFNVAEDELSWKRKPDEPWQSQ